MQEIVRPQVRRQGGPNRSGFWGDGDSGDDPGAAMATISHGPFAEQLPVANMTVGEIRRRFGDRFDIAPESRPYIDGEAVNDDTTVRTGQLLVFMRRAGEKGGLG